MNNYPGVGFEVLITWVMKRSILWDTTPCSPLKINRRFGGTCRLFHAGFLLGLFFDPEDEGDVFLRNVGRLSTDYRTYNPALELFNIPGVW
jgi:hypothetical protein